MAVDSNLGSVKNHDIDAFGDAYEYLMTMYASNAGESGGEFFIWLFFICSILIYIIVIQKRLRES